MNKTVVFDLDGTIYYGDTLAYYAKEALSQLEEMNYNIIFLTNNSTKSREEINNKLINLDIESSIERVYTSAFSTAKYLKEKNINKVFLIGSNSFKKELNSLDIRIVNEKESQAVIIGLDVEYNYKTLCKALIAVLCGAKIIVTNIDKNFPIENNLLKPGTNAIVSALLGSCDKDIDYIVGKPNTYMIETIAKDYNLEKKDIIVIGDGIDSDIAMANNYGCKSILVGKDSNSLKDVINIIKKGIQ